MGMSEHYQFTDLLADFQSILKTKEVLMEDERARAQSASECDAANCSILRRSEREKKESDGALSEWFFVDEEGGHFDDKINDAVYQELLDSIHVFMERTVRISSEELQDIDAVDKEKGIDDSDYDHFVDSICSVLEKKKKSSSRFKDITGGGTAQKFMTITVVNTYSQWTKTTSKTEIKEQDSAPTVEDQKVAESTSGPKEPCFMDALCAEIEAEVLKENFNELQIVISAINSFVDGDGGDTDAVIEDLEKVEDSNILTKEQIATHSISVWSICQKFIAQTTGAKEVYSSGWRYFYWPFYAENEDEKRIVWKGGASTVTESNPGYQLKDWFIPKKYQNLKDEALHNRCCSLFVFQWKMVVRKAQVKLKEWNKNSRNRKLKCIRPYWEISYGIKRGIPITVPHIIAVLMYTNYTEASYEFSRTFRKISPFESDRVLKERHAEVGIWGKLLREAVECFGAMMA